MNVFTYGSLMFSEVWNKVVQGNYYSSTATLHGYRRFCLKGESYPGLRQSDSRDQVNGIVYHDVQAADLQRLDEFEGCYYRRALVSAETGNCAINSQVYLIRDCYLHLATDSHWDPDDFYKKSIGDFMATYTGF